jgi:tetratricopeptide (TPR) repeat protein
MNRSIGRAAGTAVVLAAVFVMYAMTPTAASDEQSAGELDTRRLKGKAYYENDKYSEAAAEFQRCIELAPNSAVDRFNLGLVLMRAREYEEALQALAEAEERDQELLAVHYIRGIIFKRQGLFEEAVESLEHVVGGDPQCGGAYYNLGVCYKALQQFDEAIRAFKKKEELTPDDPSTHYQLISLYRQAGRVDDAERQKEIFVRVRDLVDESEKTAEALERSKYSYIIEAPRLAKDLEAKLPGKVRFVDVTARSGLSVSIEPGAPETPDPASGKIEPPETQGGCYVARVGGAIEFADYDGDGDLDVYIVNCSPDTVASKNRLYMNNGDGTFSDVAAEAGVADRGMGLDAVFGDYDNDGHIDLYVANWGHNVLYRNKGDGTFEDVSQSARADEPQFGRRAIFVDYDHDNDLDIFVANEGDPESQGETEPDTDPIPQDFAGQSNTMLRNNGDGTFADRTDEAGLLTALARTRDAVVGDFDGDCDIDLFVVNADSPPEYFANVRFGRFDVGGYFFPPIPAGAAAVSEGDFNHDGRSDLVVAAGGELFLYANNGRAEFTGTPIALPAMTGTSAIRRIVVFDYNNDGWCDLVLALAGGQSLCLMAGAGSGEFRDVSAACGLDGAFGDVADLATGDLDGDGDEDIVIKTRNRGPVFLENENREPVHWLDVYLVGQKVNRSAYGATVEIASGGHYQKQTYSRDGAHFGLGDLKGVDIIRVTWPNGVAQNVIQPAIDGRLTIKEHVKVSASCGFLYTYNGRGFELVNEILGIGPLGVPMAPGVYHQPDCTELTKIESHQLSAKYGFYELRLTEELREITYADQITLRVVDHPAELEVVPNEMFVPPPFPEDRLFAVADRRPPLSAVDDRGADVLDLVRERDGRYPTFPLTHYSGLAHPHTLTLDLGDLSGAEMILLCLDGWIYWSESSTVMSIAQDPRFESSPLTLEVRDEEGRWHIAVEFVGLPTSKGLVVPVDLTGRFLCNDYRIRLSTNLCVYFDRIFVSTRDEAARCRVTELPVARADLHYRGFSRMTSDELGFERFDYADVSPTGSWNQPEGMLTRYGDVTPLLARPDDMYVIFGPGDELSMRFSTAALPPLPEGWTRDFIFYADGWVKDGDLNTKFSETVTPLPFHGMSCYPYPDSESYPETPDLLRYLRTYNTRPARSTVGVLPGMASPRP